MAPECGPNWTAVSSPNPGSADHILTSITAASLDDVWAVGHYKVGTLNQTLIIHWNGSNWSVVPSPNQSSVNNYLYGVTAIAEDDIWAVGYYNDYDNSQTLILHWDGISWTQIASPSPGYGYNYLYGVTSISSNDVWAVGAYLGDDGDVTLTMHWDGSSWTVVPSPFPGVAENYLYGVDAISSTDVWAVGYYYDGAGDARRTLTMHWDGFSWTAVPALDPGSYSNYLRSVAITAPADAWAVGNYNDGLADHTLLLRWNGSSWSSTPGPDPSVTANYLNAIAAVSSSDIWAVGYYADSGTPRTLIIHWNGSAWSAVPSVDVSDSDNYLYGLTSPSSGDVWATGYYIGTTASSQTLIERYNPCAPTATPTPFPTTTPTPVPVCSVSFSDVPEGSTFYSYIRCLACNDIVSGYSDGTFRPNNNVTRGQIAKIVSNAAGYNEAHPEQTFQDVPSGSTFYDFVERLASRAIIGGYQCGGPGEPCVGPDNKPYFRPGSNTTRGQLSKIVCLAYGCGDTITGQSFQDVPPTHTFYEYVEALYGLGAINGYACGGPGEPCVSPDNRPYFRPGALVTRGQTSKIVSTVFFPGCATSR